MLKMALQFPIIWSYYNVSNSSPIVGLFSSFQMFSNLKSKMKNIFLVDHRTLCAGDCHDEINSHQRAWRTWISNPTLSCLYYCGLKQSPPFQPNSIVSFVWEVCRRGLELGAVRSEAQRQKKIKIKKPQWVINEIRCPEVSRSAGKNVSARNLQKYRRRALCFPKDIELNTQANFILTLKGQDDLSEHLWNK